MSDGARTSDRHASEWPHSHGDDPRLDTEPAIEPDELSEWIIGEVFVRCSTCKGSGLNGECECGGTGFDWTDTTGVRALLTRLMNVPNALEEGSAQ